MVLVCVWDSIALGGLLPPALHLQLYAMNTAGTLCTVKLSSGAPHVLRGFSSLIYHTMEWLFYHLF